jgi:parallel beta-helix repeat protein
MTFCALLLCFLFPTVSAGPGEAVREIALDRAGIEIRSDVRIKPGSWRVTGAGEEGVLIVKKDGVTIDFCGAELIGCAAGTARDAFTGTGIVSVGNARVTIRNARIRGFRTAIRVEDGKGIVVEDCDLSRNYAQRLKSTPEREDGSDWLWPHDNDNDEWRTKYGAGIWLKACDKATIRRNGGSGSQNGIVLSRVTNSEIYDNDFSFNSGWGLAMWRSCRNSVTNNRFDWCVRGYSHNVYWRGQDSTGILFFEQCSDNFFGWNSATHGGDGFFLFAGNETLRRTGKGGCNRNVLYRNDFSHAVANGIEATFSDGNRFIENKCNDCQHGFWLGYSYNNEVIGNEIRDCSGAGIAWEHGHASRIEGNRFSGNAVAVDLWWDNDKDLIESPYGERVNTDCADNVVANNLFEGDRAGVRLREAKRTRIVENRFFRCAEPIAEDKKCKETRIAKNTIDGDVPPPEFPGKTAGYTPPKTPGSLDAFLPEEARRGRQYILIDEWGPYDFKEPKVWPASLAAGKEARFFLYGPEGSFRITRAPQGLTVTPVAGEIPGSFTVTAGTPGLHPFTIDLESDGKPLTAAGTLLHAAWRVKFFHWKKENDPREHQQDWDRLLKGEPVEILDLDAIAFQWQGGRPSEKVNSDYFGTLATASLPLPAGTYGITTISDDGIRLWVDGRLVIDNWTWHPPTEDKATVTLKEGVHAFRIEHFEINGHGALSFSLSLE